MVHHGQTQTNRVYSSKFVGSRSPFQTIYVLNNILESVSNRKPNKFISYFIGNHDFSHYFLAIYSSWRFTFVYDDQGLSRDKTN